MKRISHEEPLRNRDREEEKRLIHLTVSAKKNFVYIKVENYCEEKVEVNEHGILPTSKADKDNHGFGIKSICYAVQKYDGGVNFGVKNNWFLPKAFAGLPVVDFGWPGIPVTLFGETFKWNILGYDAAHGGLPYFCAYMIAMLVGECLNFPLQRNVVFRSKGNLAKQIGAYFLAFCIITCIVNSINCVWVAIAGMFVPDFIYNIGTTVLNGGVSMVIFFFVNKAIFPSEENK